MDLRAPVDRKQSRRNMLELGMDLDDPGVRNLAEKRFRRGECPTCGTRTHKVGRFFGKREPLTIDGKTIHGRCLKCKPVEGYAQRPPDQPFVPRTLEVEHEYDDGGTVVSAITMDHRLIVGARNFGSGRYEYPDSDSDEYDEAPLPRFARRPEPSVGDLEDDGRPDPNPRRAIHPERSHRKPLPSLMENETDLSYSSADRRRESRMQQHPGEIRRPPRPPGQRPTPDEELNEHNSKLSPVDRDAYGQPTYNDDLYGDGEGKMEAHPPNYALYPPWHHTDTNSGPEKMPSQPEKSFSDQREISFVMETPAVPQAPPSPSRPDVPYSIEPNTPERPNIYDSSNHHEMKYSTTPTSMSPRPKRPVAQGFAQESSGEFGGPYKPAQSVGYGHPAAAAAARQDGYSQPDSPRDRYSKTNWNSSGHGRPGAPPLVSRDVRGRPDDDLDDPMSQRKQTFAAESVAQSPAAAADMMMRQLSHPPSRPGRSNQSTSSDAPRVQKVTEIPTILHCLNLDEATSHLREKAFRSLAEIIWKSGQKAKSMIAQYKGIETLVKSMWADMPNASVQDAAANLLFALAASSDGISSSDVLVGESAEGAVDALLIVMQAHLRVESIQESGCKTLCCLATASANNKQINDATLSGAVLTVINAMDTHSSSRSIQEWGIRALYAQCVNSANSESNKRSLVQSDFENGKGGALVVLNALNLAMSEPETAEWACKLLWCVTGNKDLAGGMTASPKSLYSILKVVKYYLRRKEAAGLMQAAFGALANCACLSHNQVILRDAGTIPVILDALNFFTESEGVNVEGCCLLANLAINDAIKEEIIGAGAIPVIARAIHSLPHSLDLFEEALRALTCLTIGSNDAKEALSEPEVLSDIVRGCKEHEHSVLVQEMMCSLLASICILQEAEKNVVINDGVNAVASAMSAHPNDRSLQQVACVAFRNISCHEEEPDRALGGKPLAMLLDGMTKHKVDAIHLHGCCVLWNLAFKAPQDPEGLFDADGVTSVVKSMQDYMESGPILEMACGALWSLLDASDNRKQGMVDSGGIDAVTCALVMHPTESATLEKALGVLSSVSVQEELANAVASAQGVTMVVEAMRSNSSSLGLLGLGSLVLRNLILVRPDCASEAESVISTIINAMRDNSDAVDFQREACNALWVMAARSESLKSKILALDGVAVLMSTMECNNNVSEVQEAALGAFHQLSAS